MSTIFNILKTYSSATTYYPFKKKCRNKSLKSNIFQMSLKKDHTCADYCYVKKYSTTV